MFVKETAFLGDMSPNWFFGIDPKAFGVVGAIVNFVVAIVVTKMTPPVPAEIPAMVDNFRIPAGAGAASDH